MIDGLLGEGEGSEAAANLVTGNEDGSGDAAEPNLIYCNSTTNNGRIDIELNNWSGGLEPIKVSFSGATYGIDFSVGDGSFGDAQVTYNTDDNFFTVTPVLSSYPMLHVLNLPVYAYTDNVEPDPETVSFSLLSNATYTVSGSASVDILDKLEGVNLTANPSTASEFGSPDGVFHLQPGDMVSELCTSIHWEVKNTVGDGLANFDADYTLADDLSGLLLTDFKLLPPTMDILRTIDPRSVQNDADFQLTVHAIQDLLIEGDEAIRVRAYVPALLDHRTGFKPLSFALCCQCNGNGHRRFN